MSNMSYCRFQNTASDLQDIATAIEEDEYCPYTNEEIKNEGLRDLERAGIIKLLDLVQTFHEDYRERLEDLIERTKEE
tara:strand:- start:872 stop:1105 length:234 start_codon:yes stop_codon:yes gene_type:complete